jgi:hypothetical protein
MEDIMVLEDVVGTSERLSASTEIRDTMKFKNGDVSLDVAVESIIKSGRKFTMPNKELLVSAVNDTPW